MRRAVPVLGALLLLLVEASASLAHLRTATAGVEAPPTPATSEADPRLDLAALKGRVVYVDFWASWCAPCRESFPWMNKMQREFGSQGLVIIGVNVDHEHADAVRFMRELGPQFRIIFDPDGKLPERFGVRGMPTSFLIDRNGHVQSRHEGFRLADRDSLAEQIRSLVMAH